MEENTKEISLSQYWTVFKKALTRGIIYILVCVIVVGALLIVLRSVKRTSYTSATITLGGELDDKSKAVLDGELANAVNAALIDFKNGTKQEFATDVLANLNTLAYCVSQIDPKDETLSTNLIPAAFQISLKNVDAMNIDNNERNDLLSKITYNLLNFWDKKSVERVSFNYDINSELQLSNEYYQIIDQLISRVSSIKNSIKGSYDSIISKLQVYNGKLKEIITKLSTISTALDDLRKQVIEKAVERYDKDANGDYVLIGNLSGSYDEESKRLEREKTKYKTLYDQAIEDITNKPESTSSDITTSGSVVVSNDDSGYLELVKIKNDYLEKYQDASNKQAALQYQIDKINDPSNVARSFEAKTHNSDVVKNRLYILATAIGDLVEDYNSQISKIEDVSYSLTGSKIRVPARTVYVDVLSIKKIAIILVAVAVVAYGVAYLQTFSKLKKQKLFKECEEA